MDEIKPQGSTHTSHLATTGTTAPPRANDRNDWGRNATTTTTRDMTGEDPRRTRMATATNRTGRRRTTRRGTGDHNVMVNDGGNDATTGGSTTRRHGDEGDYGT